MLSKYIFFILIILSQKLKQTLLYENQYYDLVLLKNKNCENLKEFFKFKFNSFNPIPNKIKMSLRSENFIDFKQLDFACLNSSLLIINSYYFAPNKFLIINKRLDLNFKKFVNENMPITVKFIFIDGIDLELNIFKNLKKNQIIVYFYYINFQIYSNSSLIRNCSAENTKYAVFKNVYIILFSFTVKYNLNTCPLIFQNSMFFKFSFYGLSQSWIKNNLIEFTQLPEKDYDYLNFTLESLYLKFYKTKLTNKTFNRLLFKNVSYLNLKGHLISIQQDLFKNKSLTELVFELDNFRELLYLSNKWMIYLDKANKVRFTLKDYDFPDTDFCLFKNYPVSKLNTIFGYTKFSDCSCLLFYLLHKNSSILMFCSNLNDSLKCDYKTSLSHCDKKSLTSNYIKSRIDYFYDSEIINFITIILTPLICLLGMFINIVNILILRSKNENFKNEIKNSLYKLMLYNSVVNFVYSFLNLFHLFSNCVQWNGIFCSIYNKNIIVQYYDIFFIDLICSILKTVSNFLALLISVNRYLLLNKESKLNSLKNRKFILLIFSFILIILNIDKLFTNKAHTNYENVDYLDYSEFPIKNTFMDSFSQSIISPNTMNPNFSNKTLIFYILFVINFTLNDFIFFILLILSDLILLLRFKSDLKKKKNFFKEMKTKINKTESIELKITLTVCFNSALLMIFRSIEFSTWVFVFYQKTYGEMCLSINKICTNSIQFGNFFYLITCSYTFFVYYFLNNTFRGIFKSIFKPKKNNKINLSK